MTDPVFEARTRRTPSLTKSQSLRPVRKTPFASCTMLSIRVGDVGAWADHLMEVVSRASHSSANNVFAVGKRKLRSQPSVKADA
jgi:hypothetical protein